MSDSNTVHQPHQPQRHVRIRLEQYDPLIAMQILPAAIMYRHKAWKTGGRYYTRITVQDGMLQEFLFPYQPERISNPYTPVTHEGKYEEIKFPLETCLERRPVRELADRFFNVDSLSFFNQVGFPANGTGQLCKLLHEARTELDNGLTGSTVYCTLRMDGEPTFNTISWEKVLKMLASRKLAAVTHYSFVPVEEHREFSKLLYTETMPGENDLWKIVRNLLSARFYFGGYNIIAQLAIRLQVPAIILTPQVYLKHEKFPLETSERVVYVQQGSIGEFASEDVQDAIGRLERMLVSESRSWY